MDEEKLVKPVKLPILELTRELLKVEKKNITWGCLLKTKILSIHKSFRGKFYLYENIVDNNPKQFRANVLIYGKKEN